MKLTDLQSVIKAVAVNVSIALRHEMVKHSIQLQSNLSKFDYDRRRKAEQDDTAAVWYIIIVLLFYSTGIIIGIITYLKRERQELIEEQMMDEIANFRKYESNRILRMKVAKYKTLLRNPVPEPLNTLNAGLLMGKQTMLATLGSDSSPSGVLIQLDKDQNPEPETRKSEEEKSEDQKSEIVTADSTQMHALHPRVHENQSDDESFCSTASC